MRNHRNPRASVSKQPTPDNPGAPRATHTSSAPTEADVRSSRPEFEYAMNGLRLSIGRTDALADALHRYFDERDIICADPVVAERRASHLIDLTAEAALQAIEELDRACEAVGYHVNASEEDADARS